MNYSEARKIIWVKNVFYAHCTLQLVEKYFITIVRQFIFINKKVAQRAILYTKKNLQPQNRKSKKMKYGDYFGRKLFLPH
jgi:hypothetical protein